MQKATLETIYWRDIPTQVILRFSRRDQVKLPLDDRFLQAVDKAAMRAKLHDDDAYLQQWRKASEPLEYDERATAEQAAQTLLQTHETTYNPERLAQLVAAGGVDAATAEH